MPISSSIKTIAATAAFALLHSALASNAAKRAAERLMGTRRRNALYRPVYNAASVATTTALVAYIYRQPSRTLYHVRGPLAWSMRLGQAAALGCLTNVMLEIGFARFAGLPSLSAWLTQRRSVPREPEGQNPFPNADGQFNPGGVFQLTRHPANFFGVPLLWLNPRMTDKLLAFNAATTLYLYLGSMHTDRRLRQRYGLPYEAYRRRVPLFLPRVVTDHQGVEELPHTPTLPALRGSEPALQRN